MPRATDTALEAWPAVKASGEQLVYVALVAHVEHKPVHAGIELFLNGDGELHDAQIGRQMPAVFRHALYQIFTNFRAELRFVLRLDLYQIVVGVYRIQ